MAEELSELEARLFEWIRQSDFHTMPWSTSNAAKAFKVKKDEIYELEFEKKKGDTQAGGPIQLHELLLHKYHVNICSEE